ncbi:MAG: DNA-binding response regulator [Piscirickettsiaceae bacterium]|nr:MAG: DNA-binding response regulator [Piscirickettsiaceae bacterium]
MLVDDHAVVRAGYRHLMSTSSQIDVIAESDTAENACQLYAQLKPDVVVMDLNLPNMTGLECIRRIILQDSNAAILAFTIHDELIYLERALQAGAKGYLTKSCDPRLLLEGIEAIAKGRTFIAPLLVSKQQKKQAGSIKRLNKVDKLSPREFDVYCLLIKGYTTKDIADTLFLSQKTVANYATQIKAKFGAKTVAEMTHLAASKD